MFLKFFLNFFNPKNYSKYGLYSSAQLILLILSTTTISNWPKTLSMSMYMNLDGNKAMFL